MICPEIFSVLKNLKTDKTKTKNFRSLHTSNKVNTAQCDHSGPVHMITIKQIIAVNKLSLPLNNHHHQRYMLKLLNSENII
jgi:hypothetical protein